MDLINTDEIPHFPDGIHLGYTRISEEHPEAVLNPSEREEFHSFKNDKRKAEYLSSRHLFRYVLKRAGLDADKTTIQKEEGGKPYAVYQNRRLHVSFSHSNEIVMCAVSLSLDMGVDTEPIHRKIRPELLKRILNEREFESLSGDDPLRLWTVKEAVVKCLGTGLRTNLRDITLNREEENLYSVRFNNDISFEICTFQQLNHQIAIAY